MTKTKTIPCSNCGAHATRAIIDDDIQRTSCEGCDYLLIQCLKTGRVIEAYAPGVNSYCRINPVSA